MKNKKCYIISEKIFTAFESQVSNEQLKDSFKDPKIFVRMFYVPAEIIGYDKKYNSTKFKLNDGSIVEYESSTLNDGFMIPDLSEKSINFANEDFIPDFANECLND